MAVTVGTPNVNVAGARFETTTQVTLDSSYPTGGYALTPAQLGIPSGDITLTDRVGAGQSGGYTFEYDYTNKKLKAYSGGSEVANATDLHTITTRVAAVGR